jgi:hypothetical protein
MKCPIAAPPSVCATRAAMDWASRLDMMSRGKPRMFRASHPSRSGPETMRSHENA